jgi:hypothetical protein
MSHFLDGLTRRPTRFEAPTNPGQHSSLKMTSRARLRVVAPDGSIRQETPWIENIMTTFGLASLASRVGTTSGANVNTTTELVSAIKIGTGTNAASSTDTSLTASTASVTIGNASFTKTNLGNRTVEYQATFASNNPAGTATIDEVGLYLNSTAESQLFNHIVLGTASVNKLASDVINVSVDTIYTTA